MLNMLRGLTPLLLISLLTACNPFTQYVMTEQQLNDYIQKNINYEKKIALSGLANANLKLSNIKTEIGRQDPNKVTVTGQAKLDFKSVVLNQSADIELTLQAQPIYDHQQGAIFLKELELTHFTIQPDKMQSTIEMLLPALVNSMQEYFNTHPAYVLNGDKSKAAALAKMLVKEVTIKPGEVVISFSK